MSVLISDSFKIRENTSDEWENIQFSINSPGVPAGGQVEQFLVKNSNLDYDTKWATPNVRYFFSLIWGLIYPVGSIYISVNSTSPETLFGGTWEAIEGRFLIAADSTFTAGSTGGEATHILTIEEMPAHTHHIKTNNDDFNNTSSGGYYGTHQDGTTAWYDTSWYTQSTGGGQAHNNIPPYLAVYMWKRTA